MDRKTDRPTGFLGAVVLSTLGESELFHRRTFLHGGSREGLMDEGKGPVGRRR